jgi:hypothetical protein
MLSSILLSAVVGTFQYSGNYSVESHRHEEIVDTRTQAGQSRLQELIFEKYDCLHKMEFLYNCSRFLPPGRINPSIIAEIENNYKGMKLELSDAPSAPSLIFESDYFSEWSSQQQAKVNSKTYPEVYYTYNGTSTKLVLRNASNIAEHDFVLASDKKLTELKRYQTQSGKIKDTFFVAAEFVKNEPAHSSRP